MYEWVVQQQNVAKSLVQYSGIAMKARCLILIKQQRYVVVCHCLAIFCLFRSSSIDACFLASIRENCSGGSSSSLEDVIIHCSAGMADDHSCVILSTTSSVTYQHHPDFFFRISLMIFL